MPNPARELPLLTRDNRNALICEVDSAIREVWPTLRDYKERGFYWPDGVLTDAIAKAVDRMTADPTDPRA